MNDFNIVKLDVAYPGDPIRQSTLTLEFIICIAIVAVLVILLTRILIKVVKKQNVKESVSVGNTAIKDASLAFDGTGYGAEVDGEGSVETVNGTENFDGTITEVNNNETKD